ncbi:hypothetical protein [Clostridium thermosuccinogenes]|uniref:hypothetical protein n=1 Tax=Clostridium thermosuccinogenes TaxID=84032 RepID=UPI001A9A4664|nr:hypothetical protein [Pseudoclostridium thermosuccinogenes]
MAELQSVNQYMVAPCNQNFLMRKDELVSIAFMQLIMLLLFTNRKAAVGTPSGLKELWLSLRIPLSHM